MKRILHLYHDLMNLYGDWANAAVLKRELDARGVDAVIEKKSVGDDIDFDVYDFIYIGSGTERSQVACIRDLMQYKDVFIERINEGIPVLATGNSHELFGRAVTDFKGNRHEMLGLVDFETEQLLKRVTGDCIYGISFLIGAQGALGTQRGVGFINRAGGRQLEGNVSRPFIIKPREGANYKACTEGIIYKNLIGTYITGPILVRNPPLLQYFGDLLTGCSARASSDAPFFAYQQKAYGTALHHGIAQSDDIDDDETAALLLMINNMSP